MEKSESTTIGKVIFVFALLGLGLLIACAMAKGADTTRRYVEDETTAMIRRGCARHYHGFSAHRRTELCVKRMMAEREAQQD